MTQILKLKCELDDPIMSIFTDVTRVTKEQLETIVDGWLILDEGYFDDLPNGTEMYVTKIYLSIIDTFFSTKPIDDDRLLLIDKTSFGYKYLVKEK